MDSPCGGCKYVTEQALPDGGGFRARCRHTKWARVQLPIVEDCVEPPEWCPLRGDLAGAQACEPTVQGPARVSPAPNQWELGGIGQTTEAPEPPVVLEMPDLGGNGVGQVRERDGAHRIVIGSAHHDVPVVRTAEDADQLFGAGFLDANPSMARAVARVTPQPDDIVFRFIGADEPSPSQDGVFDVPDAIVFRFIGADEPSPSQDGVFDVPDDADEPTAPEFLGLDARMLELARHVYPEGSPFQAITDYRVQWAQHIRLNHRGEPQKWEGDFVLTADVPEGHAMPGYAFLTPRGPTSAPTWELRAYGVRCVVARKQSEPPFEAANKQLAEWADMGLL